MNFAINTGDNSVEFIDRLLNKNTIKEVKQLAKKRLFACPYCQVSLNVRSGDARGSHFAHPPNTTCLESKQVETAYRQYQKQIKRESFRHSILVSMIKDEIETACKGRVDVEIIEGYRVNRFTPYYPDLYVCIGSREWAITVLTDMSEKENLEHAKNFKARHSYFLENNLEPLWLIDKANFAEEKEKRSIILWQIEWLSSLENSEDYNWKKSIGQYTSRKELFRTLGYTTSEPDKDLSVKSIYYLSREEEKNYIRVLRYIDDRTEGIYRGFLIGETSTITFGQALYIENESFRLRNPENEIHLRQTFKEEFLQLQEEINKKVEQDNELNRKQIGERKRAKEVISAKETLQKSEGQNQHSPHLNNKQHVASHGWRSPYALTYDEQMLDKRFYEFYKLKNSRSPIKLSTKISEIKYKEFEQKLLIIRVQGESYIVSPNDIWRKIILDWLNENYTEQNWTVSVQMLLDILRKSDVEFTNNTDEILKFPIKGLLEAFNKAMKKIFKLSNDLEIKNQP